MRKSLCLILAFLILFPIVWAPAQQLNTQEERIQKLERIIQDQAARIQDLQNKVEKQPSKEYTEQIVREYMNRPEVQEAATVTAGYEKRGFFIRTADGDVELYISGYVQMGLAIFENSTHEDNSFFPNGITLALDTYFCKVWHGRLQMKFMALGYDSTPNPFSSMYIFESSSSSSGLSASPFKKGKPTSFGLLDAYVEYVGIPEFNFRAGRFHAPFSIEGQYSDTQGMTIFSEPYIRNWSHGRDYGLMLLGTLGDMVEYKLAFMNGEGGMNMSDDFLMGGSIRVYPFKKSENPNTFFHLGVIRSRDNNIHNPLTINSASLTTPWGRYVYSGQYQYIPERDVDGNVDEEADGYNVVAWDDVTCGWKTGVDVGFKLDMFVDEKKTFRIRSELEFMYMSWQRHFGDNVAYKNWSGGSGLPYFFMPDPSYYQSDFYDEYNWSGRMPYMEGYGVTFGLMGKYNFTPELENTGLFFVFKFSYSDVDNKNADGYNYDAVAIADGDAYSVLRFNPTGQRIWTYTFGLGYTFCPHVTAQFNWVICNIEDKTRNWPDWLSEYDYMHSGTKQKHDDTDSLEQAWFFQITAEW